MISNLDLNLYDPTDAEFARGWQESKKYYTKFGIDVPFDVVLNQYSAGWNAFLICMKDVN